RLTRPALVELARHIRELGADAGTHVIVIKSRGETFCGGRDARGEDRSGLSAYEIRKTMDAILGVYEAINAAPVPVIALVQGPGLGFGAALAGGCDITLASDKARFAFNEIKHGTPPTLAMSAVLRKVPAKALTYLIYSGAEIDAKEALAFGLVSKVVPASEFAAETAAFVSELAGRPRLVLETIKKFQNNATGLSAAMASEYAGTLLALVRAPKPRG
ncbi:MAG TPA: enoyl-CoA hydratase/isomerase family protein, partial [Hyphomicrobiaceae bacterium]|nr:enoyl-CoA hydratase/isomerase family protein [Hyphomicrobiaceae bacterium]